MKKANILVALGTILAVAAGALASKAKLQRTYYSNDPSKRCLVTISLFVTTTNLTSAQKAHLSIQPTLVSCPTINLITDF